MVIGIPCTYGIRHKSSRQSSILRSLSFTDPPRVCSNGWIRPTHSSWALHDGHCRKACPQNLRALQKYQSSVCMLLCFFRVDILSSYILDVQFDRRRLPRRDNRDTNVERRSKGRVQYVVKHNKRVVLTNNRTIVAKVKDRDSIALANAAVTLADDSVKAKL